MSKAEKNRYLQPQIEKDLLKKMVFLGGPRQVGKTTLAKKLLKDPAGYLNWDSNRHRELILKDQLPDTPFWVFDEIHKYKNWRNYVKGLFDTGDRKQKILITGSARLDFYRHGGDSLQGRYHFLRLHPLSFSELKMTSRSDLLELFKLGGFPEPFFSSSDVDAKRWTREYRTRFIKEDLVSLEKIDDLTKLELMLLRLPDLVGSPLSINSLRQDLGPSHKTISRWLDVVERLYGIFRILPFGAPKLRAVKKEQKHYHFDWTLIKNPGFRFENMIACHLLKWVQYLQDTQGREVELQYFRDIDGREVDFLITEEGKVTHLIECKLSDDEISKGLRYMHERFPSAEAWQISLNGKKDYVSRDGIRVAPCEKLVSQWI